MRTPQNWQERPTVLSYGKEQGGKSNAWRSFTMSKEPPELPDKDTPEPEELDEVLEEKIRHYWREIDDV